MSSSPIVPFADPCFGVSGAEVFRAAATFNRRGAVGFATIVSRQGVSARPVGAQLIVAQDGAFAGSMSSGCIDGALAALVLSAMVAGAGRRIRIGAGSPLIDIRLPCGGSMEILITVADAATVIERVNANLCSRRSTTLVLAKNQIALAPNGGDADGAFRLSVQPPLRLALAGRGANLTAIARAGAAARFDIAAWSPDPDDARSLASAGCIIEQSERALIAKLDARAALVLMFHDHEREIEILKAALGVPSFYIGAMGARVTQERRLETLRRDGVDDNDIARIRGPIGLIPSVRDPDALAISVLAEIMQVAKAGGLL